MKHSTKIQHHDLEDLMISKRKRSFVISALILFIDSLFFILSEHGIVSETTLFDTFAMIVLFGLLPAAFWLWVVLKVGVRLGLPKSIVTSIDKSVYIFTTRLSILLTVILIVEQLIKIIG